VLQGGLPGQPELLREQLEQVEVRLKEVDNNQRKLLNKVIDEEFPQDMIIAKSKKLNAQRARLIQQKAELEEKIERAIQAASNMAGVERFCELARHNIDTFSDEDWKTALEALAIKLVVYPERVCIEGSIPVLDESSDSSESFLSQTSPSSVSATFA
jgi:ABC-type phosphate transport system auxiliary subunit